MAIGKAIQEDARGRARLADPSRRHAAVLFLAALAAAFLGAGTACRADGLLISAPGVTAAPGTSGSFDVTITNTNALGGASFDVASDTVELSLTGPSGVSFTGVSIATADTYIYGANSATNNGFDLSSSTFPGTTFETNDFLFSLGAQTIGPQQTFGLVHVTYTVDAGALPGMGSLTFGSDTSLFDANGGPITDFTAPNGSFTIMTSSVPEPSSLILLALGGVALGFHRTKRHPAG